MSISVRYYGENLSASGENLNLDLQTLMMTNLFCAQMKRPVFKLGLDVMFSIQLNLILP
jgi:hypothetical protein